MIDDDPPLLVRIPEGDELRGQVYAILESYKRTLQEDRRHLLDRFRFVDAARKVVGVGSVGTRATSCCSKGATRMIPCSSRSRRQVPPCWRPSVRPYEHHEHHGTASWPAKG